MRNLVKNKRVFGPDAKFIWDGQVREARFPLGPKLSERRVDADWSTTFMNSITAGAYDGEAINIYFVGYVQTNFNQPAEKPIGWTVNPDMVGQEMHHYWRPSS